MKRLGVGLLVLGCWACWGCGWQPNPAPTHPQVVGQDKLTVGVRTWMDMKFDRLAAQEFDYSCGPAALATILKYYYGHDVSEQEILRLAFTSLSEAERQDRKTSGLTMLDLAHTVRQLGFVATPVRLSPAALAKLGIPVVVFLQTPDYQHYSVFRGVLGDRVLLADPSSGNTRMPMHAFLSRWSGHALVVERSGAPLVLGSPLAVRPDDPAQPELLEAQKAADHLANSPPSPRPWPLAPKPGKPPVP